MKKNLIVILSVLIIATIFAACGQSPGAETTSAAVSSAEQTVPSNPTPDSTFSSENGEVESPIASQSVFGKVESITGNKLVLLLAKFPDYSGAGNESSPDTPAGQEVPAATMTPAIAGGAVGESGGMELEYTGETITVTIPAGAFIQKDNKRVSMADIKNGSVINLTIDNMEDLKVSSVEIWE